MVVRISARGEAGMVARPGLLRKTATETAAEAEASGFFFRGRGAQAGFDAGFEAWLGEGTGVEEVGGGGLGGEGALANVARGLWSFRAFEDAADGVASFAFRGLEELFGGFGFRGEQDLRAVFLEDVLGG